MGVLGHAAPLWGGFNSWQSRFTPRFHANGRDKVGVGPGDSSIAGAQRCQYFHRDIFVPSKQYISHHTLLLLIVLCEFSLQEILLENDLLTTER